MHTIRDEITTVGQNSTDDELVCIKLNGFTKEWSTFIQVVFGHDKLPYWDYLWSDFTQEDLRLNLVEGTTHSSGEAMKVKEEQENVSLAEKEKQRRVPTSDKT